MLDASVRNATGLGRPCSGVRGTRGVTASSTGHAGVVQTLRESPRAVQFALLGVFVANFGAFLRFFLVLYLSERGFSVGQAGFALGVYSAGAIVGTLVGGNLTDRLGPRWTIVVSVGSAAAFTLSITMIDAYAAILCAVALAGMATMSARPAMSTLLFSLVPPKRQVMMFAMYRTAMNIGAIGGPLVAVWLSTFSWDLVFWVDAACALTYCAIALVLLPRGRVDSTRDTAVAEAETRGRPPSYLTVLTDRRFVAYLVLMLANGLVYMQIYSVFPLMLDAAGYPAWAYGMCITVSASMVVGLELIATRRTQTWPLWAAMMGGWALLIMGRGLLGLPGGIAVVLIGVVLATSGQIMGGPAAFAYPAKVAPQGASGRYIASAHAMFDLGCSVGPILGVVLWTMLGNGIWGLVFAFGVAMIAPGIWATRPPGGRGPGAEPVAAAPDAAPESPPGSGTVPDAVPGPGGEPLPDREPIASTPVAAPAAPAATPKG